METIYIETTIVSYLVANPSRDLDLAAHQRITRAWWQKEREHYRCLTSEEVLREVSLGDTESSRLRTEALAGMLVLQVSEAALLLSKNLVGEGIIPAKAFSDAIHVAVASLHQADILLTWNCRHLANPHLLKRLRQFMIGQGLLLPEICTPVELEGSSGYED